jgi:hypothetical protein
VREKDITTLFRDLNTVNGVFELKLCKGTSIPFNAVKVHQATALMAISDAAIGMFYKIPDSPIFTGTATRFAALKPFDCFRLAGIPAFVVICYYVPRKYKHFYYIQIWDWKVEEENSPRKSLTEARAAEIAKHRMDA